MIASGAPDEVVEAARLQIAPAENDFEVWAENWDSVLFFLLLGTQWRALGGMERVHWLGLDYAGVEITLRAEQIPRRDRHALWADLRIMESAALEVLNKTED